MKNNKVHIITRCTRPHNLKEIHKSLDTSYVMNWHVIFDASRIHDIDVNTLELLYANNVKVYYLKGEDGDYGHNLLNNVIETITEGWVYILDDDNLLNREMFIELEMIIDSNPDCGCVVFSQEVGGRDFTKLDVRVARPENMKVGGVDMAQFIIRRELIGDRRFPKGTYVADGIFITELYEFHPEKFIFCEKILTGYNALVKKYDPRPRILAVGCDVPGMDRTGVGVNIFKVDSDRNLTEHLNVFRPHAIITEGEWKNHENLSRMPYYVRRMWLNNSQGKTTGEIAYGCAMNSIIGDEKPFSSVSYFTPLYNTGDRLIRTYRTLAAQTVPDWEWVIVNDSDDGGHTLRVAKEISKSDPRVRLYDIRPNSGGIVGEAKHRAVSMCRFDILAELDHDDLLLPDCTEVLLQAVRDNPEGGFFFSDYGLVDDQMNPKGYGDDFIFGYGSYYETDVYNRKLKVVRSNNINPKTIRHIVGIPNHIRVWTREGYLRAGGYNRQLSIADDYDLFVRTFLTTEIIRIEKCLYLQVMRNDGGNTHVLSRNDIQRRVHTLRNHYEERIGERFRELGVEDWAYLDNPSEPLRTASRFGDLEGYVNRVWSPVLQNNH
jgi:glycosyltransferase involved in cell wall biosynthesis